MTEEWVNIRLSPRVRIRLIDSLTGSYPTISRVGDPDRSGRYEVRFDDTRTVIFRTATLVDMPTTLHKGSQFLVGITGIETTGVVRKGVADEVIPYTTGGGDLRPFDETRVPIGPRDDPFYRSGSIESAVGFGFTSPLFSKTSFRVDLGVQTSTTLQLSASTVADTLITGGGRSGSFPMAYYNFGLKRWDRVGRGIAYDTENAADTPVNSTNQMIGFSASPYGDTTHGASVQVIANASQSAVPMDNFGFPMHQKFHATSSQVLSLSDYIDRPFVLEKVVYEFTASFSGSRYYKVQEEQFFNTFFILNQKRPFEINLAYDNANTFGNHASILTASVPASLVLAPGGSTTAVNTGRELVTWMQVASHLKSFNSSSKSYRTFGKRELNFRTDNSTQWSGSFALPGTVKSPAGQTLLSYYVDDAQVNEGPVAWRFGGRGNTGYPSGRDLVAPMPANPVNFTSFGGITVQVANVLSSTSPYILHPDDNLVFGWQVAWFADNRVQIVPNAGKPSLTLLPGHGKVTFFGSQLRENVEFHDTMNQPLTSPAIHEALHYDNPIIDQFDTEPLVQFSGSSGAEFITGSIFSPNDFGRKVIASTVVSATVLTPSELFFDHERTRGLVGNSVRVSRHSSLNERFFDTVLPSATRITVANGGHVWRSGDIAIVVLGHPISGGLTVFLQGNIDETWNRAFPFEPRYASIPRLVVNGLKGAPTRESTDGSVLVNHHLLDKIAILRTFPSSTANNSFVYHHGIRGEIFLTDPVEFNADFFGLGGFMTGSPSPSNFTEVGVRGMGGLKPQGFKYGVFNAAPVTTSAVWRRNRYGQFRDMLEQRLDSKFYDTVGVAADGTDSSPGARVGAVRVRFVEPRSNIVTSPSRTWSSNLNYEVTSSLPYFDGAVRNREEPINTASLNPSV